MNLRPDPTASLMWPHHPVAPPHIIITMFIWGQKLASALYAAGASVGLGTAEGNRSPRFSMLPRRFAMFDRTISACKCEQLVLMGAGFESRPYNTNPECIGYAKRIFEVDRIETQRAKRQLLTKANLKNDAVTFVTVNFATESWSEKLLQAGFNPSVSTYFLWEGVAGYLPEEAVIRFFNEVAVHLEKNVQSRLAFNCQYRESHGLHSNFERFCVYVGEPHISTMPMDVEGYLKERAPQLKVLEHESVSDKVEGERMARGGIVLVGAKNA